MNNINLNELAQGAIDEQFQSNFQTVVDNIYDPNTPAKTARKLVIEMTLNPDAVDREMVKISVKTKVTLAPATPIETKVVLDYDPKSRKVTASEWGSQMKGRVSLEDEELDDNIIGFAKAVEK